jgi:hypothetical protein
MEAEVETLTSRKLDFSRSNNSNLELQGWRQAFPRRFLFTLLSTDAGSRDTCTARFRFPLCLLNARKAAFETPQELIGLRQLEIPRWWSPIGLCFVLCGARWSWEIASPKSVCAN